MSKTQDDDVGSVVSRLWFVVVVWLCIETKAKEKRKEWRLQRKNTQIAKLGFLFAADDSRIEESHVNSDGV